MNNTIRTKPGRPFLEGKRKMMSIKLPPELIEKIPMPKTAFIEKAIMVALKKVTLDKYCVEVHINGVWECIDKNNEPSRLMPALFSTSKEAEAQLAGHFCDLHGQYAEFDVDDYRITKII